MRLFDINKMVEERYPADSSKRKPNILAKLRKEKREGYREGAVDVYEAMKGLKSMNISPTIPNLADFLNWLHWHFKPVYKGAPAGPLSGWLSRTKVSEPIRSTEEVIQLYNHLKDKAKIVA